jgi:hypothetical protein
LNTLLRSEGINLLFNPSNWHLRSTCGSNAASVALHVQHFTLQPIFLDAEGVVIEVAPNPVEGIANLFSLDVEAFLHGLVRAKNLEGENTVFVVDAE